MFCLPIFPLRRRSSIFSSHTHLPHTPSHSSNLDVLSGCEARASQESSEDFRGPALVLLSHSRLGATERCSVTPPPPSPSEDHYASPLLPSLRSCSGMSCVWMPLAPAQASLGLNSLWLVLLPLAGQLLVLAALLVVNPDPDATGVVGSGKRKAGQGRSGRPMFLSGYHIRYRYRGLDDTERCSVTPPPPSPSGDHHASPLLPSLQSCMG
ncbi:hypothetical protein EDB92DRAFT_556878 [Lactarius akahatsu]|uniref:Uncharacterized protein n=1 Tax=Lactarius akahatsu TaxID=416441 RepID=A0AAD4L564_9AGAM|nr:hypothetical protein EDB92DRAFT_556878 [Lactarius akahatsu]